MVLFFICFSASSFANYSVFRFDNQWCTTSYPTAYVIGSWSIFETEYNGNGGMNGLSKNQTGTIIIDLPSGFEFKTSGYIATITATGTEITNISFVFTSVTRLTVTLTSSLNQDEYNTLNFNDFEIRATSSVSGSIMRNGGTFKIDNATTNPTSSESLGELTSAAPFSYTSSTCMHPVASIDSIGQYTINNQILRVQITGTGNCSGSVSSFTFNTNGGNGTGTDTVRSITTAKVYYTGTSTTFSTTNYYGSYSTPNGSFTITGSQELVNGNNYFFLTYDIAGDAYTGALGNKMDAKLESFVLEGSTKTDMTVNNPTGYRIVKAARYYFSRVSGNWNTGNTWSLSNNGPTCNCQPNGSGIVIIDTNHIVDANANRIADVIEIHTGAILDAGASSNTTTVNSTLKTFGTGKFTLSQDLLVKGNVILSGTGYSSNTKIINIDGDLTVGAGTKLTGSGSASGDIYVGGNLTVNGTLEQTGSRTITMDGGVYNLSGTGTIANASTFVITNGNKNIPIGTNLTIVPNVLIGPYTVSNNGTVTIQGDLDGNDNMAQWFNFGTLNYAGTSLMFYNGGTLNATPNYNTVNFTGNSAQAIMPPTGSQFYHIGLSGTGTKTPLDDISVNGNWTNSSTFDANGIKVTFNGALAQTIGGTSVTTFYDLKINNTSTGVTLNIAANVSNILVLTKGALRLNSFTLTVQNSATTAVTRTNGYIVSETDLAVNPSIITWNMGTTTGSFIFPFGATNGTYIPVTFNKTTSGSSNVSVSTRPTVATNNLPFAGASDGGSVAAVTDLNCQGIDVSIPSVIDRWWDIYPSAAVTANVTFSYRGSENTTSDPTTEIAVQHWTGSYWNNGKGGSDGSYTTTGTNGVTSGVGSITATGLTQFTPYVLVLKMKPMPVELLSFKAELIDKAVKLKWVTASETNNDYFTLERSRNGYTWEILANIVGHGTTNSANAYEYLDENPFDGIIYYRLKQTDFDGANEELGIIAVDFSSSENIVVLPNQSNSGIILLMNGCATDVSVNIIDISGRLIEKRIVKTGTSKEEIELKSKNGSGLYMVNISTGMTNLSKKVFIN